MKKNILIVFSTIFLLLKIHAQSIPVGFSYLEEVSRRNQVNGLTKDNRSYLIRPLYANETYISDDSASGHRVLDQWLYKTTVQEKFKLFRKQSVIGLLPVSWISEYNSDHPYGWNNGPLFPNRGYQTLLTGGFYFHSGLFNMQIKPEMVYAQNKGFDTFPQEYPNNVWAAYYGNVLNGIDAPERFGNTSIQKVYPGQSRISLDFKGLSLGISTENLWWGPGIRNSILMSNSAPGFLHWTFNSVKPIKTGIGSFEWQIIGGTLQQSEILPADTNRYFNGQRLYYRKPVDTRYLSAFVATWQPKWTSGLFLGIGRSVYEYTGDMKVTKGFISKYLPIFQGLFSSGKQSGSDNQDQLLSFYLRQVFPKDKAEIYFEWSRNDHSATLRDFLLEPEHSRGYIIGGRKSYGLKKHKLLQIQAEITQLQIPPTYVFREEPSWYVHVTSPFDGYTNQGRYLGAGIGPGGNSQMIDVSVVKGLTKVGLMLERYVHNNDFYYQAFNDIKAYNRHWVDLSTTFHGDWQYKKFLLSGRLAIVRSLNYQWWRLDNVAPIITQADIFKHNNDVLNIYGSLNITYCF